MNITSLALSLGLFRDSLCWSHAFDFLFILKSAASLLILNMQARHRLLMIGLPQWGTVAPIFCSKVDSNEATHVLYNLGKQRLDGQNLATGCRDGAL